MHTDNQVSSLLKKHNLRLTEIRKQILAVFIQSGKQALSSADIEQRLDKSDRVTLYRTLKSFEETGLIHTAVDGSTKIKYALCSSDCNHEKHFDEHAHFYCTRCKQTTCLNEVVVPEIQLPKDYQLESKQLVLSGICGDCHT